MAGELVSATTDPADARFPGAAGDPNATPPIPDQPAGSATWKWHMPDPVQNYLVENSVGHYNNGYDDGVHGGVKIGADGTLFYEYQSAGVNARLATILDGGTVDGGRDCAASGVRNGDAESAAIAATSARVEVCFTMAPRSG